MSLKILALGSSLSISSVLATCNDTKVGGIEELDAEIAKLSSTISAIPPAELAVLPPSLPGFWMDTLLLKKDHDSCWIQIDLGKMVSPELVAVIPQYREGGVPSSFPSHFQVTLSNSPEGENSIVLSDYSDSPFPLEKNKFLLISNELSQKGRYLRITPSFLGDTNPRAGGNPDAFRCALSEIFVFSGEANIALNAPVTSSVREVPNGLQKLAALTDGWSPFGAPENPATPSIWEGYHSFHSGGKAVPEEPYWIQIDLGEARPVDQINLIPVNPNSFPQKAGYGFPVRFKIETSIEEGFSNPLLIFDSQFADFPVPTTHHLSFAGTGAVARYVRLTAFELFRAGWNSRFFAVAEMQVISEGLNISEGRATKAFRSLDELYYARIKEEIESSADPKVQKEWESSSEDQKLDIVRASYNEKFRKGRWVWGESALVDGFSSRYELVPLPDFLRKLHEREEAEFALGRLQKVRNELLAETARSSKIRLYVGLSLGSVVFIVILGFILRYHAKKRKALSTQLAQDLHDDLSSEICNMSLIAQQLVANEAVKDEADRKRLRSLVDSSQSTVGALRDLIFLTNREAQTWSQTFTYLRKIPETFFEPLGISFHFSTNDLALSLKKCTPRVLRNVILIYKEALHNICKHSAASHVKISVVLFANELTITIVDDGRGILNVQETVPGFGMWSMRMRAEEIGGRVKVESDGKSGTCVTFKMDL